MKLSEKELNEIEQYAFNLLTWKDISHLMGINLSEFKQELDDESSPIHFFYWKGKIKRKALLRKPVLELAEMGAPQAELLAQKFMEEQNDAEIDE